MKRLVALFVALVGLNLAFAIDLPEDPSERFGNRVLLPLEGIWMWNSGAFVAIEAASDGRFVITLLESPDPLVETPCFIGTAQIGGSDNSYNLELKSSIKPSERSQKNIKFIGKMSSAGRLSLTPYSTGVKINASRLIPYLFRFSISKNKQPDGLDGAIKVWPSTGHPEFPIIL